MISGSAPLDVVRSIRNYVAAIHVARVLIASVSLAIAIDTRDQIPHQPPFGIVLAVLAVVWTSVLAFSWGRVELLLARNPRLIWLDGVVMVGLSLLDKPWDSLVALPYCSFVLLVPYVRPQQLAYMVGLTAVISYLPKLVLTAANWEAASLVPPTTSTGWFTLYVGPVFCGTVAWALCLLFQGIRSEAVARDQVRSDLARAEIRHAGAAARLALANRLHETLSQVVRAIPLRLDGGAPDGLSESALAIRREIRDTALDARPAIQRLALKLRAESQER